MFYVSRVVPELPEVETIKSQLAQKIVGKKLQGKKITSVRRRAKLLIIDFEDGSSLVFHLKLTGQLLLNVKPSKHTRKVFNFDDGTTLVFNNMRGFGWWKEVKNTAGIESALGPEPFALGFKAFQTSLLKRPRSRIKPLLMDQKFIAGIGNIYSDEILFAAGVKPTRLAKTLSKKEAESILQNMQQILKAAIKARGSSSRHYVDALGQKGGYVAQHKVYHKDTCPKCKGKIKKMKIGGRSAHFCPNCQK